MARAITILGFGDTMRQFGSPAKLRENCIGEIWTMNNGWCALGTEFQADRWFALHSPQELETGYSDPHGNDALTMLNTRGCPVYMRDRTPRVARSRAYPFRQVFEFFGSNYFLGSPSLLLMLALYEGVTHIRSWGIDMTDELHWRQRTSWVYWWSTARTMGVEPSGTALAFMSEQDTEKGLQQMKMQIGSEITAAADGAEEKHGEGPVPSHQVREQLKKET